MQAVTVQSLLVIVARRGLFLVTSCAVSHSNRRTTRDNMLAFRVLMISALVATTKFIRYDYGDGSFYVGTVDNNGRPSGQGKYHNSSGHLTYRGNFSNGHWHGYGTWYGRKGDRYEGEFDHGQGNGKGTWYRANNEMIVGEFKNHTINGKATWYYGPDQSKRLEGNFRRGHAHGYGVMYLRNGAKYEGMFKKGYAHGHGKLVDQDEEILYEGAFKHGIPEHDVGYNVISDVMNTEFPMRLSY